VTVAESIAEYLAKKGCTHAFGIIGGANLAIFCEIAKRLTVVSMCHEQAASMAALYYYKASGRMAPCLVTAGGGAANAITGVIEAHMDSIPLLVISGNEMSKFFAKPHSRSLGFQGFNPVDAVGWCTKAVVSADNGFGAMLALDGLYRKAMTPRQGAVWLDVPQDIATGKV
jgi:acetolactate synthase I/II/III large subunit